MERIVLFGVRCAFNGLQTIFKLKIISFLVEYVVLLLFITISFYLLKQTIFIGWQAIIWQFIINERKVWKINIRNRLFRHANSPVDIGLLIVFLNCLANVLYLILWFSRTNLQTIVFLSDLHFVSFHSFKYFINRIFLLVFNSFENHVQWFSSFVLFFDIQGFIFWL